uniref:Uncharacterized protein n=1 Tax=Rhizophora mucronata TaxID=61149 RepID=A0A2P2N7E9_RHIMU
MHSALEHLLGRFLDNSISSRVRLVTEERSGELEWPSERVCGTSVHAGRAAADQVITDRRESRRRKGTVKART